MPEDEDECCIVEVKLAMLGLGTLLGWGAGKKVHDVSFTLKRIIMTMM